MRGALGPWTLGHGQAGVLKGFVNKPNPFQTLPFKGQGKDNHSRVTQKKSKCVEGFCYRALGFSQEPEEMWKGVEGLHRDQFPGVLELRDFSGAF